MFLVRITTRGVLFHSATLLIIIAILTVATIFRRHFVLRPIVAATLLAILGELLFSAGVRHAINVPPLRPPFLTARLLDDGPGRSLPRPTLSS